jgi:hypothetical protein
MRRQSVPFFILSLEEEADFRGALPVVAMHLDQHYAAVADVAVPETRGLRIFVERDRGTSTTDPATGWPCFARGASGS